MQAKRGETEEGELITEGKLVLKQVNTCFLLHCIVTLNIVGVIVNSSSIVQIYNSSEALFFSQISDTNNME